MKRHVLTIAVALFCAPPAAAQEVAPMNAFAMWQGQGQIVDIGENRLAVIGAFGGPFFVETTEGPVETGTITCPLLMQIDSTNGRQVASGSCLFIAHDGARAYGDWDCTGVFLIGCKGTFTLKGGAGRLAGISGTSSILFRGRPERLKASVGMIGAESLGIAVWRDLKVTLPAPKP